MYLHPQKYPAIQYQPYNVLCIWIYIFDYLFITLIKQWFGQVVFAEGRKVTVVIHHI